MTVRELLQRITSYEIEEWKCYFALRNEKTEQDERDGRVMSALQDRQRTMGQR